jgi:hypothetical protein
MSLYENIHALRKKDETSKVGMNYTSEENQKIMEMAEQGIPCTDIARTFKRTTNAIRTRIAILAAHRMSLHNLTLEEASRKYHIGKGLLSKWYSIQCDNDRRRRQWFRDAVQ